MIHRRWTCQAFDNILHQPYAVASGRRDPANNFHTRGHEFVTLQATILTTRGTMGTTVTIDKSYFETLIRRYGSQLLLLHT